MSARDSLGYVREWLTEDLWEKRRQETRAERLRDILAESTAADAKELRLALATIAANEHGTRTYDPGGCGCVDGRGCSGHVPETTKIARAALGLTELPDPPRKPLTEPPAKEKRELLCERCDKEHPVWFAPNAVWNPIVRPNPDGPDEFTFLCPTCFIVLAEERGMKTTGWMVAPEGSLETVTTWRVADEDDESSW